MVAHQRSLFGGGEPKVNHGVAVVRTALSDASWLDVGRGWLTGADTLLDAVIGTATWRQGRRRMYDRMVDDPRLSSWYRAGEPLPHPALDEIGDALSARYGVAFGAVGINWYRDGHDSVAYHRDRELRELDDTLICIVTLGTRRPFLIRPIGRGASRDVAPAGGDLLVMGGACQQEFEHGVPKVASAGPRVSLTWRASVH
jgi:alkylated DNA repair dioxygenase AlkB